MGDEPETVRSGLGEGLACTGGIGSAPGGLDNGGDGTAPGPTRSAWLPFDGFTNSGSVLSGAWVTGALPAATFSGDPDLLSRELNTISMPTPMPANSRPKTPMPTTAMITPVGRREGELAGVDDGGVRFLGMSGEEPLRTPEGGLLGGGVVRVAVVGFRVVCEDGGAEVTVLSCVAVFGFRSDGTASRWPFRQRMVFPARLGST
jgi:hypothetical protein